MPQTWPAANGVYSDMFLILWNCVHVLIDNVITRGYQHILCCCHAFAKATASYDMPYSGLAVELCLGEDSSGDSPRPCYLSGPAVNLICIEEHMLRSNARLERGGRPRPRRNDSQKSCTSMRLAMQIQSSHTDQVDCIHERH